MNSSSAFDYPVIDPGYLSHSSDLTILREGIKLARIAGNTPPLSNYLTGETSPGSEVDTDEEWEAWLKDNARTEYHPRGSCSMLPLDQGGVVNAKLQVYGTDNVRVADSAIFPIDMSCHVSLVHLSFHLSPELIMWLCSWKHQRSVLLRRRLKLFWRSTTGVLGPGQTRTGARPRRVETLMIRTALLLLPSVGGQCLVLP